MKVRLYRASRKSKQWTEYKIHQKECKKQFHKAETQYVNNIITEGLEKNDRKPFWRYAKAKKRQYSRDVIFPWIPAAQRSSLTIFVNRVNSLRKFEGGGGGGGGEIGHQNRVTALQSHRMELSYFPLQSRGVLNDQEQWRGDLVF